jgi:hypothetical protein
MLTMSLGSIDGGRKIATPISRQIALIINVIQKIEKCIKYFISIRIIPHEASIGIYKNLQSIPEVYKTVYMARCAILIKLDHVSVPPKGLKPKLHD